VDGPRRFEILYSKWLLPLFLILGLGSSFTRVELSDSELTVRMGWGFYAKIPRSSIRLAERSRDWPWAIGVHTNMRGSWLVNGSSEGIVSLQIDPPVEGRCLGVRMHVKKLGLGLADPDGFLAAVGAPEA
jgi:hypothetical protein